MKELAEPWRFRPRWVETVFLLLVCSALAAAAAGAFPTLADAYLNLLLREHGPSGVFQGQNDLTAVALLLSGAARAFSSTGGSSRWSARSAARAAAASSRGSCSRPSASS